MTQHPSKEEKLPILKQELKNKVDTLLASVQAGGTPGSHSWTFPGVQECVDGTTRGWEAWEPPDPLSFF